MPGALSDYLEQKLLDYTLAGTPFVMPAAHYVSLHTSAPSETGTPSNEVTGGTYARQTATFGSAVNTGGTWAAANSGNIAFTGMPPCTVTHVAVYDGATAVANLLYYGALASGVVVASGGTFVINAGSLSVTLD